MPGRSAAKPASRRAVTRAAVLATVLLLCWPAAAPAAQAAQAAASAAQAAQAAGDWTRWKYDAANTGVNPAETRLGPGNVRGLRRSWFRSLCCGGGTPLVAGGVVYLGAEVGGPGGPGAVYALDAATGRRLWTTELTPGTSTDFYEPPNVAGGVVYVTAGDTKMRALDAATGRLLWRAYVTRTEGATGTAAVSGGLAYVVSGDGVLLAKDVANGVNRWKASLAAGGGRGRPVGTVSVGGGRAFVATEDGSVLAYAAAGCRPALACRPLWVRQGGASSPFDSTLAVGRTTVFVGAPTGSTRWTRPAAGAAGPAWSRASARTSSSPRR